LPKHSMTKCETFLPKGFNDNTTPIDYDPYMNCCFILEVWWADKKHIYGNAAFPQMCFFRVVLR